MAIEPDLDDVRRIAGVRAPWCVTIYGDARAWLRMSGPGGIDDQQIRTAVSRLRDVGAPGDVVRDVKDGLTQARERLTSRGDLDRSRASVAIFATATVVESFVFSEPPESWVGVGHQFLIGPLLAGALRRLPRTFVLAVSESSVRLIDATAQPPRSVDVPGLPADLRSALELDVTRDRNALERMRVAVEEKERLRQYARIVDLAIEPVLRRAHALLVIAAAEPLASIMRAAVSHLSLAASRIPGSHDGDTPHALAEAAAPLIERHRRAIVEEALARLIDSPSRERLLIELDEIARAARDGAIRTLFVDVHHRVPSRASDGEPAPSFDRVDQIIRDALAADTMIIPVGPEDLPGADPVAAILRYVRVRRPHVRAV